MNFLSNPNSSNDSAPICSVIINIHTHNSLFKTKSTLMCEENCLKMANSVAVHLRVNLKHSELLIHLLHWHIAGGCAYFNSSSCIINVAEPFTNKNMKRDQRDQNVDFFTKKNNYSLKWMTIAFKLFIKVSWEVYAEVQRNHMNERD